jgi:predicted nuclease with RNAse H fold
VGIDLAGSQKRNTGICTLKKDSISFCTIVHTDQEIINYVEK